jgi:hypothetical protein
LTVLLSRRFAASYVKLAEIAGPLIPVSRFRASHMKVVVPDGSVCVKRFPLGSKVWVTGPKASWALLAS